MIKESVDKLGPLTVMVANAGIAQVAPALDISDEDVLKMFNVNFMQVTPKTRTSVSDVRRPLQFHCLQLCMLTEVYRGVWLCYTHAARQMISQGAVPEGGSGYKILGAASIVAFKPFPLLAHYSASKWAVRGFTQVFAMEMAKHKINVNAYAPGIVGTAMWDQIDEKLGAIEGRAKGESVKKYSSDLTASGRISVPEDVGNVVG